MKPKPSALISLVGLLALSLLWTIPSVAEASRLGARLEFWEGVGSIEREKREMRREILQADSPREARQAYREGMREIAREKREMRREIRRELRRDW